MAVWLNQADVTVATLLVFFRLSAFFVIAPFPGFRAPPTARIALAAGLAWGLSGDIAPVGETGLFIAVIQEVVLGLTLGFLLQLVIQAFAFGGEAAGTQMGLGTPGFANPLDTNLTLFGTTYTLVALGVYAAGDGPLMMVAFLHRLIDVLPPGAMEAAFDGQQVVVEAGRTIFFAGMQAAAPLIAAVFAAQLVLAVLARSVPTLNLLVEGPSLTIGTGIIGFIASAHTFIPLVDAGFNTRLNEMVRWLEPLS